MDKHNGTYRDLHRPASEFATRDEYLEHELQIMQPKRWRPNLPFRDYRFEWEDLIPAMAGTIGKVVMVGAVAAAFAAPLGLPDSFVLENVRYELLIAAAFILLVSGFFLPGANLPGTHGPLIPMIPIVVSAGGHPLAFGISIAVLGLLMALFRGGSIMAKLTSNGVCGGLLLYLGFIGTTGQVKKLFSWAGGFNMPYIAFTVIIVTIVMYALLEHWKKRWLAVPLGCLIAGVVAFALGAPFEFHTAPGLPPMSPAYWWGENSGWHLGLPTAESFLVVFPFAVLAVAMWSPDFLGHQVFQKISYPEKTDKVLMNIDDTMTSCSVRQAVGSILGGCKFYLFLGNLYRTGIDCQTPHSGRCGFNGGFMYYRRVMGLSDGLGDLAAGIERSLGRRRILTAFGSGHGNDAQRQNHPIRRHRGVLFRLGQSGFRLGVDDAVG